MEVEGCKNVSIVVMCNASDTIEYDRRRSGLSNAPVDMSI